MGSLRESTGRKRGKRWHSERKRQNMCDASLVKNVSLLKISNIRWSKWRLSWGVRSVVINKLGAFIQIQDLLKWVWFVKEVIHHWPFNVWRITYLIVDCNYCFSTLPMTYVIAQTAADGPPGRSQDINTDHSVRSGNIVPWNPLPFVVPRWNG